MKLRMVLTAGIFLYRFPSCTKTIPNCGPGCYWVIRTAPGSPVFLPLWKALNINQRRWERLTTPWKPWKRRTVSPCRMKLTSGWFYTCVRCTTNQPWQFVSFSLCRTLAYSFLQSPMVSTIKQSWREHGPTPTETGERYFFNYLVPPSYRFWKYI